MTNKEAMKVLNNLLVRTDITDEYGDMEDMTPYEEAVEIAIKAIEQTQLADNDRAISLNAVLNVIDEWVFSRKVPMYLWNSINKLPPVTPQPKTGYWIENTARKNLCNCSECMALSNVYSDFCPHCGADMRGNNNE